MDSAHEAERLKERAIGAARLEARNKKLGAKQKQIDKVFEKALEELNNLPKEDFVKFVKARIDAQKGDFIAYPEKYKLTAKDYAPATHYNGGDREISGGFIVISGGIEQNNTFSSLIDFQKNDLEQEVIKILFG
ncbi:hypothetical protein AGMMS49975_20770 [Clostridia bacterium]|nr:hypothetical protein AGMMS49975_20770 [Clostridia bacterium]